MGLLGALFSGKEQHEWHDVYGMAFGKNLENPTPITNPRSIYTEKYRHGYVLYACGKNEWRFEEGSWTAEKCFPERISVERYREDTEIMVGYCLVGVDRSGNPQHLVIEEGMTIDVGDPEYLKVNREGNVQMEGMSETAEYVETVEFKKSTLYVAKLSPPAFI